MLAHKSESYHASMGEYPLIISKYAAKNYMSDYLKTGTDHKSLEIYIELAKTLRWRAKVSSSIINNSFGDPPNLCKRMINN